MLRKAREARTRFQSEHLARDPVGDLAEVEGKGKAVSVPTIKTYGVEV
jgi:hypothetical protein